MARSVQARHAGTSRESVGPRQSFGKLARKYLKLEVVEGKGFEWDATQNYGLFHNACVQIAAERSTRRNPGATTVRCSLRVAFGLDLERRSHSPPTQAVSCRSPARRGFRCLTAGRAVNRGSPFPLAGSLASSTAALPRPNSRWTAG
jgi:hypothetical protein